MAKSVQEISRSLGNYVIEYGYIGMHNMRRVPMIGYYRCWAVDEQAAADQFRVSQRYFRNDCCNVLQVWQKAKVVA